MSDADDDAGRPDIGWGRAIASGAAILLVGFVATVYVPNLLATKLTGLSRSTRQDLASVTFLVALVALAWCLRRLQARRLI